MPSIGHEAQENRTRREYDAMRYNNTEYHRIRIRKVSKEHKEIQKLCNAAQFRGDTFDNKIA